MKDNSFQDKNVFVTGSDGFIGSHLVEDLVENGAKVKAMIYYNSWNNIGWLSDVDPMVLDKIEIYPGDIRDYQSVLEGVKGCHYVFHLSSLIAIPYSYQAPRSYIDTNIIGAHNVLEACRQNQNLERLVHVSTSEVYGSAQTVPISEKHPLVGQSPYSASKIGADKIAESYHLSFDLPVVIARPFNTFGPRQTARAVIPSIISQVICDHKKIKLGALSPTRDFNFVKDTVNGMMLLAKSDKANGHTVNIGSGKEWSIKETAEMIFKISGKSGIEIITDEQRIRPSKSEVNRLIADNQLIKEITGWRDEVGFEQGLEQTYRWIEKNLHHFDVGTYAK